MGGGGGVYWKHMKHERGVPMKKLFGILLATLLLFGVACAAEPVDLSTYTDAELDALRIQVAEEIRARAMAKAPENPAADFRYVSNGTEVRINSWIGEGMDVYIPDEIDGVPVTQIGSQAFANSKITSLRLPDGLVSVGLYAFNETRKMNCVVILPPTVETIEQSAFYFCGLTGLVVQSDCTLGVNTFSGTTSLKFLYIREGSNVSLDSRAFCVSGLEAAVVPDTVQFLDTDVFASSKNVTVYCPAGSYAEQYCKENFIVCDTANYGTMVAYYEALYPAE